MAAADAPRGSSAGRSSSGSSNNNGACTRFVPAPVIAVSPSHTLEYDCTDCGSFLFGHRGRLRTRPQGTRSGAHHHSRGSSISEPPAPLQDQAQRLLLVGSTPVRQPCMPAVSQNLIPPQNEQQSTFSQATEPEDPVDYINATVTGIAVSNDASDPVSLHASDDEVEEVATERVTDFVACHGASPVVADNVNDSSTTLAEIFRCFICLGKVVDAQLCPCCSKLVCQPCIKRWLTDQKSECPHCRAPLLVSQLVSCRFISEISLEVEKIQGKLGDSPNEKYCPTHDSPLLYFCTTCAVAVCSDCAVLIEDHRNHTFEKLSVAYGRHKKKIRMEAAGLRKRRKELSALVASVDKNIETVLKSKDESAAELQMAFKRMQSRLEEQLKCKLLALLAQKGSMTQEMELLDTILDELDQQLNSIPKSDLIAQEPNMSRMLQDIRTRTFSDISRTPISSEFTSEVVPSFEHGELVLKTYKENLSQTRPTVLTPGGSPDISDVILSKDVVYSEPICASGVTWRLKVYPNGSGASQGTHLSVFLEMVDGGNEPATYEYGIELLHRSRPNQRIVRKFSSDFEGGACWGYYQFFRIDLLEKEGYLQPEEDAITLRFYVRPLTYQQQCQDLRRSLAALQAEREESATQVAVIRRAFAATFFQRRRRRSGRAAGHLANEQAVFAQAVAAGAGTNIASPTLTVRKASAHIPRMRQLQVKIHEHNGSARAGKWLPGVWPQADQSDNTSENLELSQATAAGESVEKLEARMDHCSPTVADLDDNLPKKGPFAELALNDENDDGAAPSVELIDMRRKNRNQEGIQTPKSRAHKKLRNRKLHKLTLLAPESYTPFTNLPGSAELAQHLAGLSIIEAGPSAGAVKKLAGSAVNQSENSESANGDESEREKCENGSSDTVEGRRSESRVVTVLEANPVEGVEENKYPYYRSMSGSSINLCTPEIEETWGNLN